MESRGAPEIQNFYANSIKANGNLWILQYILRYILFFCHHLLEFEMRVYFLSEETVYLLRVITQVISSIIVGGF